MSTEHQPPLGFMLRHEQQTHGWVYSCEGCGATDSAAAAIPHDTDCKLSEPNNDTKPDQYAFQRDTDAYPGGLNLSTWTVLRNIELESEAWFTEQDRFDRDSFQAVISDIDGVRWTTAGSTARVVAGLGRTTPRGAYHRHDQRGIVVKVDPRLRFDAECTASSSNYNEITTWETAVETDTSRLFADILEVAPDGCWLAMEYCIPIAKRIRDAMTTRDMLLDHRGEEYISPFLTELQTAGWQNPDYKHGNIGLTDDRDVVLLDYGTGPNYEPAAAGSGL